MSATGPRTSVPLCRPRSEPSRRANPDTLYGIFGSASWTNKDKLPDRKLADLIEQFSTRTLSNTAVTPDVFGNAY